MSGGTSGGTALAAPARPQVNLLPAEVRDARALGVVKRWTLAAAGVTAVAIVTVAGVAQLRVHDAGSQLAEAEAESLGLVVEQKPFAEVTGVRSELDAVRDARQAALAGEILWADRIGAVTAVMPAGVAISSLEYVGGSPLEAAPVSADPLVPTGVGTLSFTAQAADVPDTAAWADALDAVPGFRDVRVTTTTLADEDADLRYVFTGTIQIDASALAHRFDTTSEGDS